MSTLLDLKITKSQIQRLAKNLHMLLHEHRLSKAELAQALDLPVMTINRIVSGETADPRLSTLKLIADYFNIPIDFLIGDMGHQPINLTNKHMPQFIPVMDWKTITLAPSIKEIDLAGWKEWHPVALGNHSVLSPHAFALESRPSMQPRFPVGTLLFIEPDETPCDSDIVLVKMKKEGELSLRELIIDPPKWQLQPIVSGSEVIYYQEKEHAIVGVVVLTMLYARKERVASK